ncbi:N-acetylglucosaminyldiphosphodolichol N-acetylglucosaminyltransferase [Theileria orientalis]|uniref:UDP-N-acetylglucosamine transferase subunit ALG13 n=1 Tax=Theileria orientalis TaxID=68886 RepID=A0A976SLG3_THEOR|nr:N-acetylglucosaminyldiphosphodolichol N-acetylglucosaminyltransferase [Theileria orientalis]
MGNSVPQGSKTVLVTVGTSKFNSLVRKVDEEDFQRELQSLGYTHVVYQLGTGTFLPKTALLHVVVERYIDDFCSYVKESDLIISHLGAGNLLEVFKHEKQAIFVPNPDAKGRHQNELLSVLDPRFVTTLDSLKGRLRNPARGTGEFYRKLLPRLEFNYLVYDLVNLDTSAGTRKST